MKYAGIATLGDFWKVVREFNPEGVEREASTPLDVWLLGEPESGRHTLAQSLLGSDRAPDMGRTFTVFDLGEKQDPIPYGEKPDLLVLVARLDRDFVEVGKQASSVVNRVRAPALLVMTRGDMVQTTRDLRNSVYRAFSSISYLRTVFLDAQDWAQVQAKLIPLILDAMPNHRTPFARRVPAARSLVADQIIAETSRVNAQFALVANLPANLPLIGGVAGSIADFFVLTKNQVMMILRLATIYGRDVAMGRELLAEIVPVVGNALLWRSAARLAVGSLPSIVAAVPKATLAYAGTYTVGHAARFYLEHGQRPPRELMRELNSEGARIYRRLLKTGTDAEPTT